MPANAITLIFSPYHVGLRDHRVGNGPHRILSHGLVRDLERLGVKVHIHEIDPVDDFEGEIGRSFEVIRRTASAVSKAVSNNTFPLVLSGNCMGTVGAACGLQIQDAGFIYFDAHDDLDSPDVQENGYFDAMGLSMLRGESWKTLMSTVPGYKKPFDYSRFLYVGLRDQSEIQRQRVIDAGMTSIWGNPSQKVDFATELGKHLNQRDYSSAVVHLDLDCLDESYGSVNSYPSPGGLLEPDLISCMELVSKASPASLTVCSFDPHTGDGDKIAQIAIRAITTFATSLVKTGALEKGS